MTAVESVFVREQTDRPQSIGDEAISLERYSIVEMNGEETILSDETNDDAWIRSETTTRLAMTE